MATGSTLSQSPTTGTAALAPSASAGSASPTTGAAALAGAGSAVGSSSTAGSAAFGLGSSAISSSSTAGVWSYLAGAAHARDRLAAPIPGARLYTHPPQGVLPVVPAHDAWKETLE